MYPDVLFKDIEEATSSQIKISGVNQEAITGCEVTIGKPWCLNSSDLYKKRTYKLPLFPPLPSPQILLQ